MPKGPRKLKIAFASGKLTHYGGVYLLHRFFTRIGLKKAVATEIRLRQRNNRYSVGELLLAILYPLILGLERIETTHLLQVNGVFQYLSGLSHYPNATTLRRFLLRLAPPALPRLRRLHDRFLRKMIVVPRPPHRLLFDLDSTALIVYGKQEAADVGYHPFKPGRRSYHPLLCFDGQTKDFWHGELRQVMLTLGPECAICWPLVLPSFPLASDRLSFAPTRVSTTTRPLPGWSKERLALSWPPS